MKKDTLLTSAGRDPARQAGVVNPPVYRASTIIHPSVAALRDAYRHRWDRHPYGRAGTPTTRALEEAMAALEGGGRSIAVPSGKAAVVAALVACLESGDHLLMIDTVYTPVRELCDGLLAGMGIEITYFDPLIGGGIAGLIRPQTKLVYMEAPGSLTFEMPDVPAIAAAARERGVLSAIDNTWATPYFFRPFAHGVDISIVSATKYICGHADAMLGLLTVPEAIHDRVKAMANMLGFCPGSTEADLGLRGLRTLAVRLERHQAQARVLIDWFRPRPEVARVLYPGHEDDPGYAIWRRDFSGASGLFGVVFRDFPPVAVEAMIDGFERFAIGGSFGGYESLVLPVDPAKSRSATEWAPGGATVRFHAGFEDTGDLIADLERGFERLNAAATG